MTEFNLQEETLSLGELDLYQIPHELDIPSLSPSEIDNALDSAIESLVHNPQSITDPLTFDAFRSILKHADAVSPSVLSKLLDSLVSGFAVEIDQTGRDIEASGARLPGQGEEDDDEEIEHMEHKTPLEMYAFLVQWFVQVGERVASKPVAASGGGDDGGAAKGGKGKKKPTKKQTQQQTWSWPDHIPFVLSIMHKALRLRTDRIWTTTQEREAFVNCFTRPAYQIAETEARLKSMEIRLGIYKVVCLAVKFHGGGFGAQTSIMQNLTYFEHLSEPMAELLTILEKEFDHTQLTEEILREISTKQFIAQDAKGPRSFSRFLIKLSELSPRIVLKQISLLLAHLDSEAHPMRMAIIEIIGHLIRDISLTEDGEGDAESRKKQIKGFFELLFERYLDLNSWVRGKVLQTLIKLCDLPNKFPKQRHIMTDLTIRSLEDKTSSVRKHSIQLLTKLVETHPFGALHGGTLNLAEWQDRYESIAKELAVLEVKELEQARRDAGEAGEALEASLREEEEEEEEEAEGEEGEEKSVRVKEEPFDEDSQPVETQDSASSRRKSKSTRKSAPQDQTDDVPLDPNIVMKLRLTKKYYADALKFILQIESAIPTLSQLLVSTTKSEVLESMRFFRVGYEYNLQSAEIGIKTMLHLIWTKDNNAIVEDGAEVKGVRSNLIEVYKSLYFDVVPDLTPKQQVNRIAKNMIERTYGATLAELTSLEELMRTMMTDGGVHNDVINKLWQVYATDQEIPKLQRRGAIIILGMLALAKREVVTEKIDSLLKIGLGPLGKTDLVLARYTCIALQRLSGSAKKVKGSLTDKTMRLPMDSLVFEKLQQAVELDVKSSQWFGVAEQALNTIYLLGEQPDVLCTAIIKNLSAKVFVGNSDLPETLDGDQTTLEGESARAGPSKPPSSPTKTAASPTKTSFSPSKTALSPSKTSASPSKAHSKQKASSFQLAQLVFVVGHVAIKHIVYLELVEREFKRRKDETAKATAAAKPIDKDGNDLDAVAGNAEDDIGDLIATIREKELLYGEHSLLALYGPLIAHICATPRMYKSQALRQAAALALTKLMCVSAQFCEDHLMLLFKILETSKDPIIRSNIVIALGDIAVCFGSMIDENSERLYEGLTDKDLIVKKNTLMVLTHLILNGMIKVKGQLGEMAKCLEDEEKRISDLAKLFFTELSTKDNALYNNLQDVISHLSFGAHAVDEEAFETTMRFIFTFIEKEKQAESIIEKLCQRFRFATDERQWRDIAFCLSLLPFKSERSMKKLIEGLPFYQDKLHEETVYKRFSDILSKARTNKQSSKPETELKEFETILAEYKAKGEEDQALEADVAKKAARAGKKAAKAKSAARGGGGGGGDKENVPVVREKRKGRRAAVVEEEEEGEEEEDEEYEE